MKQLLITAALCVLSIFAHAQALSLKIKNLSGCSVYVRLLGDQHSGTCGTSYEAATILTIGPGTTITYNVSTTPGGLHCPTCSPNVLAAGDYITGVRIYETNGTCSPNSFDLGEACSGWPPSTTYSCLTNICHLCSSVTATYVSAPVTGGVATLTFN